MAYSYDITGYSYHIIGYSYDIIASSVDIFFRIFNCFSFDVAHPLDINILLYVQVIQMKVNSTDRHI